MDDHQDISLLETLRSECSTMLEDICNIDNSDVDNDDD